MTNAIQELHTRSIDLPMSSPGVNKPPHIDQPSFEAISRTREFKMLTVDQQNQILTDLDGQVNDRGGVHVLPAEIAASVGAVAPGAVATVQASVTGAVLTPQVASGLMAGSYAAIVGVHAGAPGTPGATTIVQKNAIMAAVQAAILAGGTQAVRDAAIHAAVLANGNYNAPAYGNAIIAAVNIDHPIIPLVALTLQPASGLAQAVYDAIVGGASANAHKNAIMTEVAQAIDWYPEGQASRAEMIEESVRTHGSEAGLAVAIIAAVDAQHPVGGVLACPVLTDAVLLDAHYLIGNGHGPNLNLIQGTGNDLWRISKLQFRLNGAAPVNLVGAPAPGAAFGAYMAGAMGIGGATPLVQDPLMGGANGIALTPANTGPGNLFEGATPADIHGGKLACHYTAAVAGGTIALDVVLAH